MSGRAFLFAGGGTGGHIFPALAIAEQIRAVDPAARCVVLCSDRPLDAEILKKEGTEFHVIPAKPLGVRPRPLLKFLRSWGPAVRGSRQVIRRVRDEGRNIQVVAMGGFVAAPAAQAATAEHVPLTLVNMDAIPGRANRWIARRAGHIVTSLPAPGIDWPQVPPIVRAGALSAGDARACREALNLDPARSTLLVTGASQGARSINRLLMRLVADHARAFAGWQVIHQTGAGEDRPVREAYAREGIPALVQPFFDGMGLAWGAADFAVSRAGAGSVAEAWANHVPAVFLPYPYHKDQHQRHNARPLEEAGGAVIAEDLIDDFANASGDAGKSVLDLLGSDSRRRAMRAALLRLGPADGARQIAELLLRNTPP